VKPPALAALAALAQIDWSRPWLAAWQERGEPLASHANRDGVAAALNAGIDDRVALAAGPLRFVDPRELPDGEAYEAFIARTARVPTRNNLHDFFNGLAWCLHPALKRRLNEWQSAEIARSSIGHRRGARRDTLTLFDENGAALQAPAVLIDALRCRNWRALFVTHRSAWADARLELFGHALLEKLVQPRKAITAHVWLVPLRVGSITEWLADTLDPTPLANGAKPHLPLPVLGVPGWWPANEAPHFYDDAEVFRGPTKETAARGPLS
jgi:Protein of unknown function (DUF3025)